MQLPLTLIPRASRYLVLLLVAVHGVVLTTYAVIDATAWLKIPALLGILLSLAFNLYRLLGAQRIVRLTLRRDGLLEIERRNHETATLRVYRETTVTPLLIVLLLGTDHPCMALPLLTDTLEADDYRNLRIWLCWCAEIDSMADTRSPA